MDTIGILTALGTPEGRADPYPLYAALHEIGEVIQTGPAHRRAGARHRRHGRRTARRDG